MKFVVAAFLLIGSIAIAQELRGSDDDASSAWKHLEEGQARFLPRKEDPLKLLNEGFDIEKEERPRNKRNPDEEDDVVENRAKDVSTKVRGKKSAEKTESNGSDAEKGKTKDPKKMGKESKTKSPKTSGKESKKESKSNSESKGNDIVEDLNNAILGGRIENNRVASECLLETEKFLSSGFLAFEGNIDIPEAEAALCHSLNSLYAQLCTPGFLKCLDATITPLDDKAPLGGKEPDTARNLQTNRYRYTAKTRCGRACQRNRRISGGQTARHLTEQNDLRMLTGDFISDYTDLCICSDSSKGSDGSTRALYQEGQFPASSEIIAAFNDRLDSLNLLDFGLVSFTEDEPDESCDRSDTVEERISVDAALTGCSDQELENNFCTALISSFNKLSANTCDPLFSAIEECELVAFEPSEEPFGGSSRTLRKLASSGLYAYNAKTRRRNTRIGGQTSGRRLANHEKQVELTRRDKMFLLQDRMLSDSSIDQCTCVTESDNPEFEPVSLAAWAAQLQLELNSLCAKAEVQAIEIEGYPVPCEGWETDVNVCPIQFMVSLVDAVGTSAEDLADFFLEVYRQLTEGKCGDFLDRSINPVNIIAEDEGGGAVWRIILEFGCVGSCEILPGQPNIFDAQGTVLIPCEESECDDPDARAPTQDEFQNMWNTINTGDWSAIPDISSLTPVAEAGSCEAAMCSNAAINNGICQEFGFDGTIPPTEIVPCDFPCFDEEFGPDPLCCFRAPSAMPSALPSPDPSSVPSSLPSMTPSEKPSLDPSAMPSEKPSSDPSATPSFAPSELPSLDPSSGPTATPSLIPSSMPSVEPTLVPSNAPTTEPTKKPKTMGASGRRRR